MRNLLFIYIIFVAISISSQEFDKKTTYVLGTFHTENTTINGVSFGAFPNLNKKVRNVKTNGIRLEIPGLGFLAPMGNGSNVSRIDRIAEKFNKYKYRFDEISNGINISTGTIGNVSFNGVTLGVVAQFGIINNGFAIAGLWNAMHISNGVQIAFMLNETLYSNGIQASLHNRSLRMKGLQIGGRNFSKEVYGVQIGFMNSSIKTKGIQIGIWNVNEKRKLPFINWNF